MLWDIWMVLRAFKVDFLILDTYSASLGGINLRTSLLKVSLSALLIGEL
jgi:hypothetical protein